jgi:hypothetical protein
MKRQLAIGSWQGKDEVRKLGSEERKKRRNRETEKRRRKKITNYKIQITNKSQSQNYKLQTKEVPFGHIVYACGGNCCQS